MNATGDPPLRADFPIEIRASDGHLLVTALMPMEEYIAGVLAGETGNFKSDEALEGHGGSGAHLRDALWQPPCPGGI